MRLRCSYAQPWTFTRPNVMSGRMLDHAQVLFAMALQQHAVISKANVKRSASILLMPACRPSRVMRRRPSQYRAFCRQDGWHPSATRPSIKCSILLAGPATPILHARSRRSSTLTVGNGGWQMPARHNGCVREGRSQATCGSLPADAMANTYLEPDKRVSHFVDWTTEYLDCKWHHLEPTGGKPYKT